MKRLIINSIKSGALLALCAFSACSSKKPIQADKERKFFGVAMRQVAPDPVYNRMRLAYSPGPLPVKFQQVKSDTVIKPVFHFELTGTSLEETARILASAARYTSYCSSVIATRKMNFETLGTIDEIGSFISKKAGINVVIDHDNREVRFLANGGAEPKVTEPQIAGPSFIPPEQVSPLKKDIFNY